MRSEKRKKRAWLGFVGSLAVAMVLFGFSFCSSARAEEKGLMGYWNFDEGSGEVAHDKSGNKNDGKINGATWTEGKSGSALKFGGEDDYVSCGDKELWRQKQGTIALWFKLDRVGELEHILKIQEKGFTDYLLIAKSDNSDRKEKYWNKISFRIEDDNEKKVSLVTETKIEDTNWHHIAITQDGNGARIYIDGFESPTIGENSGFWTSHLIKESRLEIGRGRGWHYPFHGAIDEVKIYNRALSQEEIAEKLGKDILVGIYTPKKSIVKGLYDGLTEIKSLKPEIINSLDIQTLAQYDVIIIPSVSLPAEKASAWKIAIRSYIKNGYGIILLHDACGYRKKWGIDLLFPQIATAPGKEDGFEMRKSGKHFITDELPQKIRHGYYDHIYLKKGKAGKVLMKDRDGKPVVVVGKAGLGKVVKMGNIPIFSDKDTKGIPPEDELNLVVRSIQWLNHGTPKKLAGISKDKLERFAELVIQKEELDRKKEDLSEKTFYWKCQMETDIEVLGMDIENSLLEQSKQAELNEKKESIKKYYEEKWPELEARVNEANNSISFAIDRNIDIDKAGSLQETYVQKSKELVENMLVIRDAIGSKIADIRKDVPEIIYPLKPLRTVSDKREWLKERFLRITPNCFGMHNPGLLKAMKYMKELGFHFLVDWISFSKKGVFKGNVKKALEITYPEYLDMQFNKGPEQSGIRVFPAYSGELCRKSRDPLKGKKYSMYLTDWGDPLTIKNMKENIDKIVDKVGKYPGFMGIMFDEALFNGGWSDVNIKSFRKYLKDKYTQQERTQLGIPSLENLMPPIPSERNKKKVLWMEHREFVAETLYKGMKEIIDHAHSKGILVNMAQSGYCYLKAPFTAYVSKTGQLPDTFAVANYFNGSQDQAFVLDLLHYNTGAPFQHASGVRYMKSAERYKRDIMMSCMHADGVWLFAWMFFWKNPPHPVVHPEKGIINREGYWNNRGAKGYRVFWRTDNWQATKDMFGRINKMEKYLIKTKTITPVAMLFSERTSSLNRYTHDPFSGFWGNYARNQVGIYTALAKEHIQVQPIYANGITEEKLNKFKVLIMSDTRSLTKEQEQFIRNWVKKGGMLLATGGTTIQDKWGREQKNYAFSDVFGVDYVGTSVTAGKIAITNNNFIKTANITYRPELESDRIRPTTGKIIGKWNDNTPAVVTNRYGKGRVIFLSMRQPGLCFTGRNIFRNKAIYKDYDSGIREILRDSVKHLLSSAKVKLPFEVSNCPGMVETTLRVQEQDNRYILHFLNYSDEEPKIVSGVKSILNLPEGKSIKKLFYAVDGKEIKYQRLSKNRVAFNVRGFDIHEAVVAEW